jgi:nucleoside diphosphate kinase
MPVQRTFSIIKPDATARNLTGAVNAVFEKAGLRIVAQKRVRLTRAQAEGFYGEHKARGFFGELVDFMTSGPVVLQVLEGENAVAHHRDHAGKQARIARCRHCRGGGAGRRNARRGLFGRRGDAPGSSPCHGAVSSAL